MFRMQARLGEDFEASFREQQVGHRLAFEVPAGKVTTLLGRNGVGKTTLLRTLMGLVPARTGEVLVSCPERSGELPLL